MDDRYQPQRALTTAYPKAGDPNPLPRLGVANLDGQTTWMEDPYPGQEILVPRVGWTRDGRLVAHFTDRTQTWLDCRVFDGSASHSLIQEHSRTWVEHLPLPHFLKDGRFLWLSARAGFNHLYLHDAHGRLLAPITSGPWDVRRLLGVDEASGKVFFEGTQRSAVGLDAYRCDLEGVNHEMRRLTAAMSSADACREVARLAHAAVLALRDGDMLDLKTVSRTGDQPAAELPKKEHPLVTLFAELETKFKPGRIPKPVSFYFTLGGDAQAKWTVLVDADRCDIRPGKPASGSADCVLKTSPEIFAKIVRDSYTPGPAEFLSGAIKSNDVELLLTFQKAFELG